MEEDRVTGIHFDVLTLLRSFKMLRSDNESGVKHLGVLKRSNVEADAARHPRTDPLHSKRCEAGAGVKLRKVDTVIKMTIYPRMSKAI